MSTAVSKPGITPDELLKTPDGDRYELVDGHLVERDMGSRSAYLGGRLFRLIANFCEDHRLGWVMPADTGYQCFRDDRNRLRRPDVSFIRLGRLPNEQVSDGYITIPPDLVVEILSPHDLAYETDRKVEEYLAAGVPLVWVVNPETRAIIVHRGDGTLQRLREADELNGENVLPGFRCQVGELFTTPAAKS
jgi:Uma2 family endonuclease